MLYFRFNTDNYQPPVVKVEVIDTDTNTTSEHFEEVDAIDIILKFVQKLGKDTGLEVFGFSGALNDLIGLPFDAYSVDIEGKKIDKIKIVKYILETYSKEPVYCNKSIEELGIRPEICKYISNKEEDRIFTAYMKGNNLQYITEALLWKNMADSQKAQSFNEYLLKIDARSKELIVVDPYLFCDDTDAYCDLLVKIFKLAHVNTIIVITNNAPRHYLQSSENKIKTRLTTAPYFEANNLLGEYKDEQSATPITLQVKFSADFHDRFWIADRKKGLCCGTSFNGVGKKISCINLLPDDDVTDIVQNLTSNGLI